MVATLTLLGGFELRDGSRCASVPPHVQRLVAFLALHDRPLRRAYVSGRLWIDVRQEQAFGALRTTLWRAQKVRPAVVEASSTHIALASPVPVDVRELRAAAQRALHRSPLEPGDIDRLVDAVELLPDWYDDWVLHEREQLTQLRLLALEAACEQFVAAGRFRDATTAALAAVASDPLSESSRSVLISAYLGAGHHVDAARQLADFRHRLKRELGLEPSVRIVELLDVGSRDGSQEPSTVTRG